MAIKVTLCMLCIWIITKAQQNQNCTLPPWQDITILPAKNYGLRLYANVNFTNPTEGASKAKQLIIVIHGGDRNADAYYCAMFHAAQLQGYTVTNKDIIIVAPRFMQSQDNPNSNELYWPSESTSNGDGWRGCGNSAVPKEPENQVI